MSFGAKKRENKVQEAAKPNNFYSPLGQLVHNGKDSTYKPNLTRNQRQAGQYRDVKLLDTMKRLPTKFDVNSYYNNPFYQTTLDLFERPIQEQYDEDYTDLMNNLNARNQVGSSFDALQQMYLRRGRDNQLADARLRARQASADAYGNSFNQGLALLAGLRNDRTADIQQQMAALNAAMGNQQTMTPLSAMQANFYANQKTGMENVMDYQKEMAKAITMAATASAGCWVAREVYGEEDGTWLRFRKWLFERSSEDTFNRYMEHGEAIAELLKVDPELKAEFKQVMDEILEIDD